MILNSCQIFNYRLLVNVVFIEKIVPLYSRLPRHERFSTKNVKFIFTHLSEHDAIRIGNVQTFKLHEFHINTRTWFHLASTQQLCNISRATTSSRHVYTTKENAFQATTFLSDFYDVNERNELKMKRCEETFQDRVKNTSFFGGTKFRLNININVMPDLQTLCCHHCRENKTNVALRLFEYSLLTN